MRGRINFIQGPFDILKNPSGKAKITLSATQRIIWGFDSRLSRGKFMQAAYGKTVSFSQRIFENPIPNFWQSVILWPRKP
jgi:hypothetical protein